MGLRFDWNPQKEKVNLGKHGISFVQASTVFADALSSTIADPDHSFGEFRFLTLGMSNVNRLLVVVHIEEDDEIRIISARPATHAERRRYEQGSS